MYIPFKAGGETRRQKPQSSAGSHVVALKQRHILAQLTVMTSGWLGILTLTVIALSRAVTCRDAEVSRSPVAHPVYQTKRCFWRQLASGIVTLGAVIAFLELIAIGVGALPPAGDRVGRTGLALCGTVPCYLGVTPGLTSWAQAHASLVPLPDSQLSDWQVLVPRGSTRKAVLYPSTYHDTVEAVEISVSPKEQLTAGDMVERYGRPCGLTLYTQLSILTIHYPGLSFDTTLTDGRLAVNAPVTDVMLLDPAFYTQIDGDPCLEDISGMPEQVIENGPWHGFSAFR